MVLVVTCRRGWFVAAFQQRRHRGCHTVARVGHALSRRFAVGKNVRQFEPPTIPLPIFGSENDLILLGDLARLGKNSRRERAIDRPQRAS